MLQLVGMALVAGACTWIGFQQANRLRMRVRALEELENGLRLLEEQLELRGAMPRLFRELGKKSAGPAKQLFARCGEELEKNDRSTFSVLWKQQVERLTDLSTEVRGCLLPLGETLGQCDLSKQQQAVAVTLRRLERLTRLAQADSQSRGKIYRVLGISGGAFLSILLL